MTLHDYKLICPSYLMLNRSHTCEDCQGKQFYHCLLNRCHKRSLVASAIYTAESYYNKWLRKYDSVRFLICPSRFLQSKLLSNGFSAERLVYLPNFLNLEGFTPSYEVGDYVLYVGRLSNEKGIKTLFKAAEELEVPVKIAGDGPMKAELMSFVREHKISHVTFVGHQSGEDLKQLYKNAAFLVIPSEWYENAPMTILEAYAYGKPVIGSCIGGIPEMIEHERTGMLFRAGDAAELNECIENLWLNKGLCQQMGHAARNKVEREYSSELHYEHLMELYRSLLN
jgi:glycosyltransferase involved in cell wall biosynthesis